MTWDWDLQSHSHQPLCWYVSLRSCFPEPSLFSYQALPTLRPRTVAKSAPQGPLPPGWIEAFDPTSRLPYYHHPPTQRSQWERPPPQPQQCLLPPWIEAFDPTRGIPYYYNPATGMSQWDRPAGFQLPLGGQAMPWMLTPAGTMAGWTEVVDGRSGATLFEK